MSNGYNYDLFLTDSSDDVPLTLKSCSDDTRRLRSEVKKDLDVIAASTVMVYIQITMFKGIMEDVSAFFEEPVISNENKPDEHWDNGIKVFNIPIL